MEQLEALVERWLTLPDVAERLGIDVSKVRRLMQDGELVAVRRGKPKVLSVPAELLTGDHPLPHLAGTITVLRDAGFDDVELLIWLLTPDDSLPGRPVDLLSEGQRGEVRRRAQALGF